MRLSAPLRRKEAKALEQTLQFPTGTALPDRQERVEQLNSKIFIKQNVCFPPLSRPRQGIAPTGCPPSDGFTATVGWLLVAAIFFAPWAFGSRPYWAALTLASLLFSAVTVCWLGWLRARRLPAVPPVCWSVVVFLVGYDVLSILNPQSTFDVALGSFLPNPSFMPFLPATVDTATGWSFTVEMLAYLLVIPVVADLARSAHWRRRLLGAIALAGLLVSLAGLCLKTGLWPRLHDALQRRPWSQGETFGPFDYHGNAGAFLNLVLPAAAWKAATSSRPAGRIFWRGAVGVLYAALFANSSRAALAIGVFLSPLCFWIVLGGGGRVHQAASLTRRRWRLGINLLVAALVMMSILVVNRDSKPIRRLRHLPTELRQPEYPRYLQSRAAWQLAQERPLFGAGVGTYKVLVQTSSIRGYFFAPFFHPGDPFTVLGETHEDYLQTLVEWGWIGFCGWAVLVTGAFAKLWGWLRQTQWETRTGLAVAAALLSVYLHAIGDCPLQIPALQFYTALYLGFAWCGAR